MKSMQGEIIVLRDGQMKKLLKSGGNKMKRLGIIMSMLFVVSLLAVGASAQDQSPDDTPMLYSMMGG
jgi:hypothetical protein